MKFTKEEISLCKQIYRKHGEILDTKWKPSNLSWKELAKKIEDEREMQCWTISDCLEFLREKGFRYNLEDYRINSNDLVCVVISGGKNNVCRLNFDGKTPLEACLKAVLAVLEEQE